MKILLVDDDLELTALLKEYMQQEGLSVSICNNGQQALERLGIESFDLIVLDVMMPVLSGFETLQAIRKNTNLPVIMLTAKGDKIDRILGLEMGADDYIAKPCDPRELVARIKAVGRRTYQQENFETNQPSAITLGDLCIDSGKREVAINDVAITLTSTEFDCLYLLAQNAGSLVTREQISRKVLGKSLQPFDRSIDMHMSNLRKKLAIKDSAIERIKTLRGSGYQLLISDSDRKSVV